jgi:hypothetical protein
MIVCLYGNDKLDGMTTEIKAAAISRRCQGKVIVSGNSSDGDLGDIAMSYWTSSSDGSD